MFVSASKTRFALKVRHYTSICNTSVCQVFISLINASLTNSTFTHTRHQQHTRTHSAPKARSHTLSTNSTFTHIRLHPCLVSASSWSPVSGMSSSSSPSRPPSYVCRWTTQGPMEGLNTQLKNWSVSADADCLQSSSDCSPSVCLLVTMSTKGLINSKQNENKLKVKV